MLRRPQGRRSQRDAAEAGRYPYRTIPGARQGRPAKRASPHGSRSPDTAPARLSGNPRMDEGPRFRSRAPHAHPCRQRNRRRAAYERRVAPPPHLAICPYAPVYFAMPGAKCKGASNADITRARRMGICNSVSRIRRICARVRKLGWSDIGRVDFDQPFRTDEGRVPGSWRADHRARHDQILRSEQEKSAATCSFRDFVTFSGRSRWRLRPKQDAD